MILSRSVWWWCDSDGGGEKEDEFRRIKGIPDILDWFVADDEGMIIAFLRLPLQAKEVFTLSLKAVLLTNTKRLPKRWYYFGILRSSSLFALIKNVDFCPFRSASFMRDRQSPPD
eukprot:scaffold7942_cov111-Cylindrotheca_fusiformis.AAC.4